MVKPKQILRVADFYDGPVGHPETEDLLRATLLVVARDELGIDGYALASNQPARAVCDVLAQAAKDAGVSFSKYRLAKAFLRWLRTHGWADLHGPEQDCMAALFKAPNKATR